MRAKPVLVVITIAALAAGAVVLWPSNTPQVANTETPSPEAPAPEATPEAAPQQSPASPDEIKSSQDDSLDAFRKRLLARYEGQLDQPKGQVRLLEELMRYLMKMDPDHWQDNLAALLQSWFPERSDALLQKAKAMMAYKRFMEEQRYSLRTMTPEERHDFIWAKRRELFGADAEAIWQSEIRNYQLAQSLRSIEQSSGSPTGKAQAFTDAVRQTYGESADTMMERHRQELTDRFLSLPSVQTSLQQQSPQQRYSTLRTIRQEMGMEDQALDRWTELDKTRDQRWQSGQQYLNQRERIVEQYPEGAEREQALDELRRKTFGQDKAEIIRNEEENGYFRYEQPRVYGQN
ncbi:hypothetical protein QQM79_14320 [Marinobacteraceae bacterium S3BR75-40.1]